VQTLVSLAKSQRTVICTIHSPRTDIFNLFDKVLLLSQGETVYFGQAKEMVPYFDKLGFTCPQYTNPCDYFSLFSFVFPFFHYIFLAKLSHVNSGYFNY